MIELQRQVRRVAEPCVIVLHFEGVETFSPLRRGGGVLYDTVATRGEPFKLWSAGRLNVRYS